MKRMVLAVVVLMVFAVVLIAADAGVGVYSGSMTTSPDGKSRNVIIVNTVTGDFEVFDIDNKGFDRKENVEYYDCVSYNRETKTRIIYKYLIPAK